MSGAYRTIVADPPWPQKDSGPRTAATGGRWDNSGAGQAGKRSIVPYDRMSVAAISDLPVADLAEPDAHLYLWTTNAFLHDALKIVPAWGFRFSSLLTWCKPPMGLGLGGAFVNTTEFVIFARRGTLPAIARSDSTWWRWSRPHLAGAGPTHSAKPDAFLDVVEQVSPAPRLEMFARRNRLGWDTWGNEALEHVALDTGERDALAV
jgi:N6-adenosine-specific RNA methylase IME4